MTQQLSKTQLRQMLLQKRRSLPKEVWREKSDRLCCQLQSFSLFTRAKTILAYFSFRQEPDLSSLFTDNRRWGFPRCVGQSLAWHLWQSETSLEIGNYGIKEPLSDAPMIAPTEIDLILVPTVACDRRGYRLGYGGGFYDRLLGSPEWSKIPTIGIVFDFAYLPQLPTDSWDIPLDYVATETTIFYSPK
ncbi:5-formyltetrahydrofolate cyclo-ligase [Pleurocapsales cyanobacterium LEGE 06147]|nr:5-formyltetrahydrofolate cyclo-ligase [Pleurocapsales cyanobacterium LEGE 06147]